MSKQLNAVTIAAPGFYGLNTQDSGVTLDNGFALQADNCVIDKFGRIGARKGWTPVNSTSFNSSPVRTIFEFVKADGNLTFACANNKLYGTHPVTGAYVEYPVGGTHFFTGTYAQVTTTVTVTTVENHSLTTGDTVYFNPTTGTLSEGFHVVTVVSAKVFTFTNSSGSATGNCLGINILTYSITGDNWQAVSMPYGTGLSASAHAIFVQKDQPTLVVHKLGTVAHSHADGYGFQRLGDVGNLPNGYTTATFTPNCALSYYGRLWVADIGANNQKIYFSDLQNPAEWLTGTAGSLDISAVVPTGDKIVALAAHNNNLIIFCKNHIVVYANPKDPANMTLSDVITGVGCIARDSIQSVAGTDLLFLSATGVQSLQRVIQEKSLPFRDVSKNVRDELLSNVATETVENIKAIYYPTDAMYLLSLPATDTTYCFDTRGTLQNGAARTTTWSGITPTAYCVTDDRKLYIGKVGYIGNYTGNLDNGSSYRMAYYTNYLDFQTATNIKILKKIILTAIGGSGQELAVKWGFDYSENYVSSTETFPTQSVALYNVSEYNIAEYSDGITISNIHINCSGYGSVLQLGFEVQVNGSPLSIQKIDVFVKAGRMI